LSDRLILEKRRERKYRRIKLNHADLNYYYDIIFYFLYTRKNENIHKDKLWNYIYQAGKNKLQTGLTIFDDYKRKHRHDSKAVSYRSKDYAIHAMDKMIKWKLIEIKEQSNRHVLKLTSKGIILAKLLLDIDNYQRNYYRLLQAIEDNIPYITIDELEKLEFHNSRWQKKEVNFYYVYWSNVRDFKNLVDVHFMNIVLLRCSKIMDDPFFAYRKEVTDILNEIIIKVMVNKYQFSLENYKKYRKAGEARNIENYMISIEQQPQYERKFESGEEGKLPFYYEIYKFFTYRLLPSLLEKDIIDMVLAYLTLLEYPIKYKKGKLESFLEKKNDLIDQYIKRNSKRESYGDMEYDYKSLVRLRFNTYEMFLKVLKEYENQSLNNS
jgi:hypothetical protein